MSSTHVGRLAGPRWWRVVIAGAVAAAALAACGAVPGTPVAHGHGDGTGGTRASTAAATTTTTMPPTTTTTVPPTTTTTVPPQPGWAVLATTAAGVAVDGQTVHMPDGSAVTLMRLRAGQVHFELHVGSKDPPTGGASLPPTAGPAVSAGERPILLAAFNGGFKTTAHAGGIEVDDQVLVPLASGLASVVIATNGSATVGVWGAPGFPPAGTNAVTVRQNLAPLVSGGAAAANAGQWTAWGATITHESEVARSALGVDAAGDLVYGASMSTYPADLAQALIGAGVTTAMELDINPAWVQADVAATPGGPLSAEIPGQLHSADQYLTGWTRDFVTVLAGGPAPA